MKITVLGSGTSKGVPMVGCKCAACLSINPKDKRLRVSVYLDTGSAGRRGLKLLIDTSPDLRQQLLTNNISDIDAVIYTHHHFDHVMGLDDISQINHIHRKAVPLYGNAATIERIRHSFSYIFDEDTYAGGGLPLVYTKVITSDKFSLEEVEIIPIVYYHGPTVVYGYRIGNFAYVTDCSFIPAEEFTKLTGLEVLIIDALRHKPHPTHFSFEQAIEVSKKIGAKKTYFTHINHDILHERDNALLPAGIEIAYDGLVIEI